MQVGQQSSGVKGGLFLTVQSLDTGLFEGDRFTGIETFDDIAQFKHALLQRLHDADAI